MPEDRIRPVADRVYRIKDRYVNVYVLDLGKVVLVDTGTKKAGPTIRAGLKEIGKEAEDVLTILLTHHHVDHFGTASAWQRESRARADLHRLDAPVAAGRERRRMHGRGARAAIAAAALGIFVPLLRTPPVTADVLLEGGEVLDVLGWPIEVLHVPGHTLGSCAFFARRAGILFAGDAVNGRAGKPEPPLVAEDLPAALASYRRLTALNPALLLPGHGSPVRGRGSPADGESSISPGAMP